MSVQSRPIKTLPVGARFCYRGEVWKVDHNEGYVEARAEQFSNRLSFYDAATARKSGDLCWETEVEMIVAPESGLNGDLGLRIE